jgi:hypothetical protein
MSAYDINTIIRLHSSHLPMPLPFNEDYYYQSYLAARQRSPPSPPTLIILSPFLLIILLIINIITVLIIYPKLNFAFNIFLILIEKCTLWVAVQRESGLSPRTPRSARPSLCPSRDTPVRQRWPRVSCRVVRRVRFVSS